MNQHRKQAEPRESSPTNDSNPPDPGRFKAFVTTRWAESVPCSGQPASVQFRKSPTRCVGTHDAILQPALEAEEVSYIDEATLDRAVNELRGSAHHFLKIWLTLKYMGLAQGQPAILVDTSNPTPALRRLFGDALASEELYVPFAEKPRFLTMKSDAARSVIQTTVRRWASSGSVVTVDPRPYIDFTDGPDGSVRVAPGRRYPSGLGHGPNGFATDEGTSLAVPLAAWAIWYGRRTLIPDGINPLRFLIDDAVSDLHVAPDEIELVFAQDAAMPASTQQQPLSDQDINDICLSQLEGAAPLAISIRDETFTDYTRRVKKLVFDLDKPAWLRTDPENVVRDLLETGEISILLYGPPRTGKTYVIDKITPRPDESRTTIQIHDGWGYEHLVQGLKPNDVGEWDWADGPLLEAIRTGKTFIVLEESNRTVLSQALGGC